MSYEVGAWIALLVYAAFFFDLFGFLARDELWLRLLMLAASALYLVYYYSVADRPLWDAIITNAVLAGANLIMICVVVLERTTLAMPQETAALYRRFPMLTPGQFRRLLKLGEAHDPEAPVVLTEAGAPVEHLFYVVDGSVEIEKSGRASALPAGVFIGELAFLTGQSASATVSVKPGTRYIRWDTATLRRAMDRSEKFKVAMSAQFNTDLVAKVSQSLPA
ncbi:cyclic nucleotide-binding domain-containing protein [uncultured Maritimibacter sp.]|jgi:hypothetical protein|uniref:cyclic nucleotide-binding domain-containing protein n=1 Tax=uncultured Maritimibacter sp. TaxID=991866 RepID=UPI00260990EB|nr:cyclic nucleotide-binding domain-containing protein [uncultured Maritimibacter sp.]